MPLTVTDVLLGPVEIYTGDFGAAEPPDAVTTPGAGWTPAGGTQEGLQQVVNQSWTNKVVDEVAMPVGAKLNELAVQFVTALAEGRLENFRLAYNLASAPTAKTLGLNGVVTNGEPNYKAILARGFGPDGDRRFVIIRKALSTESVASTYSRANQTYIPITWSGFFVSESIDAFEINDDQGA